MSSISLTASLLLKVCFIRKAKNPKLRMYKMFTICMIEIKTAAQTAQLS